MKEAWWLTFDLCSGLWPRLVGRRARSASSSSTVTPPTQESSSSYWSKWFRLTPCSIYISSSRHFFSHFWYFYTLFWRVESVHPSTHQSGQTFPFILITWPVISERFVRLHSFLPVVCHYSHLNVYSVPARTSKTRFIMSFLLLLFPANPLSRCLSVFLPVCARASAFQRVRCDSDVLTFPKWALLPTSCPSHRSSSSNHQAPLPLSFLSSCCSILPCSLATAASLVRMCCL